MKIKVIWIDDSRTWVRSVQAELEEAFSDNGLDPEINVYQQTENALTPILESYVDLVLVDCNLPGMRGDEFIKLLRRERCFAHIVFYSQDAVNLQTLEEDRHFLHVAHRDDITETIEVVADQAYRKYKHPAFMRGLLLSEFIDLENLMEDLIVQCFKDEGDYFRETVIHKGGESYTLAAKQKFISRLINAAKEGDSELVDKLDNVGFTANRFSEKIMKKRNVLAHAYPKYDDGTGDISLISSIDNIDFNATWFYETREVIHEHKQKIRNLLELNLYQVVNP